MNELNFSPFPLLKTERLILRQLNAGDAEAIFSLRTDESVNKYIDRPKPAAIADAMAFISKINDAIKNNKSIYWAICLKDDTELIGTICIWNFSDDKSTAEIGYELKPVYQGRGLMNEALKIVINYGFQDLALISLDAYTHKQNESSTKLLLKNKFKLDAIRVDEENDNVVIYSLKRNNAINA